MYVMASISISESVAGLWLPALDNLVTANLGASSATNLYSQPGLESPPWSAERSQWLPKKLLTQVAGYTDQQSNQKNKHNQDKQSFLLPSQEVILLIEIWEYKYCHKWEWEMSPTSIHYWNWVI